MFIARRIQSFTYGLKLPFQALRLILSQKKLLFFSLLPVLLTIVVYIYVILSLQEWATDQIRLLIESFGWSPEHWSAWFFIVLSQLIIFIVSALTFAFISSIIASPFNDMLAEKSERHAFPTLPAIQSSGLRNQLRIILIDLVKTLISAIAAFFALIFSWIPIINIFTFLLAFLLICFQYTSYPQTRRNIGVRQGAKFLWTHLYACAGFGATISFLYAMPFVSIIALPTAVVGGTLLVARAPGDPSLPPLK